MKGFGLLLSVFIVIIGNTNIYSQDMEKNQVITLGAGCFWCVEAIFQRLNGVESVVSGYSGGDVENPT